MKPEKIMTDTNTKKEMPSGVFEVREVRPQIAKFADDGIIPNSELPAVIYHQAIDIKPGADPEILQKEMTELVRKNSWRLEWAWRVYKRVHYHSTAHETLVVFSGNATIQLGGPRIGRNFNLAKGDVLIIPAGLAHENIESSPDFQVFGLYPDGQTWDMNYGKKKERETAIANISNTPLPEKDPIYGDGPLAKEWHR